MRADVLRGHLESLLLAVLDSGPMHGYDIVESLREQSMGQIELASGTAYPALHRLERGGLISSSWSKSGGRRRRVYQLTAAGRKALDEERQSWHQIASVITRVLDGGSADGRIATATLDT